MAKKGGKDGKISDVEKLDNIDDFDWPDFDFDEGTGKDNDADKNRKPVTKVVKSAGKGLASHFSKPETINRSMRQVLPKEYGDGIGLGFQALSSMTDVYNTGAQEIAKTKREAQKQLRKVLPHVKDSVPEGVAKFLEKLQGMPEYEETAQSREAARTADINSKIDELFGQQAKDQQERDENRQAQNLLNQTVAQKRYRTTMGVLSSIDQGQQLQVAFNNQMIAPYQRKSLELQYRMSYLLGDMVGIMQQTTKEQGQMLKDIVHNTALPEAVKITKSEQFAMLSSQRLLNRIGEGIFGDTANYLGDLFKNVSTRAKDSLKDTLLRTRQGISDIGGAATDLASLERDGGDTEETIIQLAASMGADWVVKRYGPKAQDILSRRGILSKYTNQAGYYTQNLGRILNAEGQKRSSATGFRARTGDFLRGLLQTKRLNPELDEELDVQGHMPDHFNRSTNRALIDIIPGLLARLLQSSERNRLGIEDVQLIRYDLATGTFTDQRNLLSRVGNRIKSKADADAGNRQLDALIGKIDEKGTLSGGSREALRRHLVELNMRQLAFDPTAIAEGGLFGGGAKDPKVREELAKLMSERYKLTKGENGWSSLNKKDADVFGLLKEHSSDLNALSSKYMDPTRLVKDLLASGNREELIALGVIDVSAGRPRINFDRVAEMYLGGGYDSADGQGSPHPSRNGRSPHLSVRRRAALGGPQRTDASASVRGELAAQRGAPSVALDYERLGKVFTQSMIDARAASPGRGNQGIAGTTEEWLEAIHTAITKGHQSQQLEWNGMILEEIMDIMTDGRQVTNTLGQLGYSDLPGSIPTGGVGGGKWDRRVANLQRWAKTGSDKLRRLFSDTSTFAQKHGGNFLGQASELIDMGWGKAKRKWQQGKGVVTDIYVQGFRSPALEARKLEAGHYVDELTGKVIKTLDDITGPVKDKITNLQVLSLEDIKAGLRDHTGKLMILDKIKGAGQRLSDAILGTIGLASWSVEGVKNKIHEGYTSFKAWAQKKAREVGDIYLPGEASARLSKFKIEAGHYVDELTGKTITSYKDITGPVKDKLTNLQVLTAEDLKNKMVNEWGVPVELTNIATAKDFLKAQAMKGIARVQVGVERLKNIGRHAMETGKQMWTSFKGMFQGWGKTLTNGIQVQISKMDGSVESILMSQLATQLGILEGINALNPRRRKKVLGDADGDGIREGSWQQQLKDRIFGGKGKGDKDGEKATERMEADYGGVLDKLSGLGDLMDGPDIDIDIDGPDGERRNRRRGRWGRMKDRLRNSRLGRSRLGRGLGRGLGQLGRLGGWGLRGVAGLGGAALSGLAGTAAAGTVVNGAIAAGGALATAGGAIATGIGAAAAGIAGFFTLPVLATVAVVAALGVGAYYAYKWYDSNKDRPLQKMRLAQYGWDTEDKDQAKKIITFEGILAKNIKMGPNGADIDQLKPDVAKDALECFDLKPEDTDERMKSFMEWFANRFKPIFTGWCNALNGIAKEVSITDVDDKLEPEQKLGLFNAVKGTAENEKCYAVANGPFGPGIAMNTNVSSINAVIAETGEKLAKEAGKDGTKSDKSGDMAADAVAGKAVKGVVDQGSPQTGLKGDQATLAKVGKIAQIASAGGAVGLLGAMVGGAAVMIAANDSDASQRAQGLIPTSKLDALRTIRFRAYGLVTLERNWVRALIELEEGIAEFVSVRSGAPATFNGEIDKIADQYGAYFELDTPGESEWTNFQSWFKARFLPVYLAHYGRSKALAPAVNPGAAQDNLKPEQLVELAQATMAARGEYQGQTMSVWSIPLAPNSGLTPNMDRSTVSENLKALMDAVNRKKLDEEAGKAGGTKDGRMSDAPGFFAGVKDRASSAWSSVKSFFGFGGDDRSSGGQGYGTGPASTGPSAPYGASGSYTQGEGMAGGDGSEVIIDHPGGGAKGDINQLPFPKGTKGFEAHKELIAAVAKMTGMDPSMLAGLIATESGFNSAVKAGTSSAQGLGQFIGSTWKAMLKKYGAAYGLDPNTPRTDARANALMTALFIRDNAEAIQKVLGNSRKVTDTDLYMAHFLGSGGYAKFLKNPGQIAASVLPDAARANASIFYTKSGQPRTTDEVIALMGQRLAKNRDVYGSQMKAFAASYQPPTSNQKPGETPGNTEVQGTEAVDATSGIPTPGSSEPVTGAPSDNGSASRPAPAPAAPMADAAPSDDMGPMSASQAAATAATQANAQSDASKAARDESMAGVLEVNRQQLAALQGIAGNVALMLQIMQGQQVKTPLEQRVAEQQPSAQQRMPQQVASGPMSMAKRVS